LNPGKNIMAAIANDFRNLQSTGLAMVQIQTAVGRKPREGERAAGWIVVDGGMLDQRKRAQVGWLFNAVVESDGRERVTSEFRFEYDDD
jgi:hypothetical protein